MAADKGLEASVTDGAVGGHMARAGLHGAILNVRVNLGSITDPAWVEDVRSQLDSMVDDAETLMEEIIRSAESHM